MKLIEKPFVVETLSFGKYCKIIRIKSSLDLQGPSYLSLSIYS